MKEPRLRLPFAWVFVLGFCAFVAFWGVVIFVAAHFISKFW